MPAKRNPAKKREGIIVRHSRKCASDPKNGGRACNCKPSYRAWVYDPRILDADGNRVGGKVLRTFASLRAAKEWRTHALSGVKKQTLPTPTRTTVREKWEAWYSGATAEPPTVLTRSGKRFKPSVLRSYEADM